MKVKDFLIHNHIPTDNPVVVRIHKLVEKHPNYEIFFLRSHFGKEQVPIELIESVFRTLQEKNINIAKSVDQYLEYIVTKDFKQDVIDDKSGKSSEVSFARNQNVNETYRYIYKENRIHVDQRTKFEAFSDDIRDALTKLNANKIIQQFPAAGKKVVESLSEGEKKEIYFNLNTLLETNTTYVAISSIKTKIDDRDVNYAKGSKLNKDNFQKLTPEARNSFVEFVEKPLQAFIKKSARYRSKEALFNDLSAALYSLSGDEEYKKTIETVEDTMGAILEGLNPEKGIIVISAITADAYNRCGGSATNHCIRNQGTFGGYQKFGGKQYLIINTKLDPREDQRLIGLTVDGHGKITNAHSKSDANMLSEIDTLLKKWGVRKYVKQMSDDEIIEMLYMTIHDESIFTTQEKAEMVIKYLPRLEPSRYERRKMINLLKYSKDVNDMERIIRTSLDMNNSEEFLANYDYLANNILKVVSEDTQAHNMVISFVKEYNTKVGLSKEDCMSMLLNKSRYVQPNRLIEIIGKDKFIDFVKAYSWEQEEKLLETLPQLFIYFLKDKTLVNRDELTLILKSMYTYETREEIRKIVLEKIHSSSILKMLDRKDFKKSGLLEKMEADAPHIASTITDQTLAYR